MGVSTAGSESLDNEAAEAAEEPAADDCSAPIVWCKRCLATAGCHQSLLIRVITADLSDDCLYGGVYCRKGVQRGSCAECKIRRPAASVRFTRLTLNVRRRHILQVPRRIMTVVTPALLMQPTMCTVGPATPRWQCRWWASPSSRRPCSR